MRNETQMGNQTNSPKPNQSPMNPPVQAPSVKPGNTPPGVQRDTKPKEDNPKIDNPREADKKAAAAQDLPTTHVMTKEASEQASDQASEQSASPSTLELWKTKLARAKLHWNKLQQDELVATEGSTELLSGLVQKRYSMNKAQADKQVEEFLAEESK